MKKTVWFGLLAIALAFGMAVVGCDNGTTDDNDTKGNNGTTGNNGEKLPASKGTNAVSGKTYYSYSITVFSETVDGAASGTYDIYNVDNGTYGPGEKYKYNTKVDTGTYSWNEEAKTVTLKRERVIFSKSDGDGGGTDGLEIINRYYGPLQDRAGIRSDLQASINDWINEVGQVEANKWLSSMGFSSVAAYLDYEVNRVFANQTRDYSFSADGNALFLVDALPANKGANELSGETYYGLGWDNNQGKNVKDENRKYVFTASGYTYTYSSNGTVYETIIGSYAYDSSQKIVWVSVSTINNKDREAYYAEQTIPSSGHHYPDDNAYRAARTSDRFSYWSSDHYNITNKTIGWED
jgi:hypothetical protein